MKAYVKWFLCGNQEMLFLLKISLTCKMCIHCVCPRGWVSKISSHCGTPSPNYLCHRNLWYETRNRCSNCPLVLKIGACYLMRICFQVSRLGPEFPLAEEHTGSKKKITVFCSNDYLGMSWHPKVQAAVMWVVITLGTQSDAVIFLYFNYMSHHVLLGFMFLDFMPIRCHTQNKIP